MKKNGKLGVIILAAGMGTRMRSATPKVLHRLADRPMLDHVIALAAGSGADSIHLVVGPEFKEAEISKRRTAHPNLNHAVQFERLGTGHAVREGLKTVPADTDRIVVLYGDIPLVKPETLEGLANAKAPVSLVVFTPQDAAGYGRVEFDGQENPVAIIEYKDANERQRALKHCNGGPMAFDAGFLRQTLPELSNDNAQGEYYLTDLLKIAVDQGIQADAVMADEAEIAGINARLQLANLEAEFQKRKRLAVLDKGVTLVAPDTVQFSYDTNIEPDVLVEPNVVFGPGVTVKSGAHIRAFSHLEGAVVQANAVIGPYARLRPGTTVGEGAKVGNFVEVKNADFRAGAKANHLAYIGDALIGEHANIGAGTITCNYDGYNKWQTKIGAGAFIGSNSALVAPVEVGDGATVAAGTTLTKNLEPGALGLTRSAQKNLPDAATKIRAQKAELKRQNTLKQDPDTCVE